MYAGVTQRALCATIPKSQHGPIALGPNNRFGSRTYTESYIQTRLYKLKRYRIANGNDEGANTTEQEPIASPTPVDEEEPVWVRRERERELEAKEGKDLPFGLYLLMSSMVAIAAVGSIFEYANKNPVFDVIYPDSPLYVPILGVFAITGLPTAGFLFYKAVSAANKEAERMDTLDGYNRK